MTAESSQVSSVCSRTSDWRKRMQRSGSRPGGEQDRGRVVEALAQLGRVVGDRDRVQVDDAVDRRRRRSWPVDVLADRADVVAEVLAPGRLDAAEDPHARDLERRIVEGAARLGRARRRLRARDGARTPPRPPLRPGRVGSLGRPGCGRRPAPPSRPRPAARRRAASQGETPTPTTRRSRRSAGPPRPPGRRRRRPPESGCCLGAVDRVGRLGAELRDRRCGRRARRRTGPTPRRPSAAIASTIATLETALLTPEATPTRRSSTASRTVVGRLCNHRWCGSSIRRPVPSVGRE